MIAPPIMLNNITNAFVDVIKFLRNITSYRNPLAYLSIAVIFLYKIIYPWKGGNMFLTCCLLLKNKSKEGIAELGGSNLTTSIF
jgi:hypothetical protein